MPDDPTSADTRSASPEPSASSSRPGLIRSIAHRLAGEPLALPVEGRLASFDGATGWLNSEPLTPEGLRGRVVLVDFWTYTCVNWLRTLPYVRAWADEVRRRRADGRRRPHARSSASSATSTTSSRSRATFGVDYPIALDSDYGVWSAFANHYWPAVYLADVEGRIRYHHFGEGEYADDRDGRSSSSCSTPARTDIDQDLVIVEPGGLEVAADWRTVRSPETYVGYGQSTGFASGRRRAVRSSPHG